MRGRLMPPRTMQLPLRLSADERRRWESAAGALGLRLSTWIRSVCEQASRGPRAAGSRPGPRAPGPRER